MDAFVAISLYEPAGVSQIVPPTCTYAQQGSCVYCRHRHHKT